MPSSKPQPCHKIPYVVSPSVIAATLGMDRTHISRILRGERIADPNLLLQISLAAKVTLIELREHIAANKALAEFGVGRRNKPPSKVGRRVRGLILRAWNDPNRPTLEAICRLVEDKTGVKVSRETVRQVVLKEMAKTKERAA